jgi:hypothetical protein
MSLTRLRKKTYVLAAVALLVALPLLTITPQLAAYGAGGNEGNNSIPPFTHVFYIMMENTGVDQLVGNTAYAPYINQLIAKYGYDNNYFGVTHTSLPNYVAAISGNNWNSYTDDPTQTFNHANLVDQLVANHISWKGYMESMPYAGYTGAFYPTSSPLYVLKHDPFLLFTDVVNNPQQRDNVVPLTQLTTDLSQNNVPQFVWISPNVCNDMHGGATSCPYSDPNALIQDGDNFLNSWVTAIMNSKAWTGNSVIFITWDEAEYPPSSPTSQEVATFTAPGPDAPVAPASAFIYAGVPAPSSGSGVYGGGNVPLIVITTQMTGLGHGHGPSVGPITINTYADHYSILRTIEQSWNLGYLGMASDSAQVQSLTGFFQQGPPHDGGFFSIIQAIESEFANLKFQK